MYSYEFKAKMCLSIALMRLTITISLVNTQKRTIQILPTFFFVHVKLLYLLSKTVWKESSLSEYSILLLLKVK